MKNIRTLALLGLTLPVLPAGALTWSYGTDPNTWPADMRQQITNSMNEAVALYNANGHFDKHVWASYNPGVPTAQANYDGWIEFGGSRNTRVALHEIGHTMGVGTYWSWDGNAFTRANALVKLYDGQGGGVGAGGGHFWPYGMNFDNEDTGLVSRERHCRVIAALRYDMGIVWDSDGDALPDDWETFNFGNLAQTGAGDTDGDGVSNFDEYTTDSNPNVAGPLSGGLYRLRVQFTNKLAEVADASVVDGGNVRQMSATGGLHQEWIPIHLGGGWWKFENANSGKVLDVNGISGADGANIQQWTWLDHHGQHWRLAGGGNGFWSLYNRNSGKVVDVEGVNPADGANIFQWSDWRGGGQLWAFDPVAIPNQAPFFTANPLGKPSALVGAAYSGSLAGDAGDPNVGDTLSFAKTGGPAWLTVAANGALGGTPAAGNTGANAFTVRVTDAAGLFAEATLNITVINTTLPAGWTASDIGAVGLAGSSSESAGAYTVGGAGSFGGRADAFRYVYHALGADGSIVARVNTLGNTGSNARVGIMIRDTLASDARMAALTVTGSGAYKWQRRTTTGGSVTTTNSGGGTAPNLWVRLVRVGNTVTASKSTNGTSWTTIGSATVTMASNCYVGLAVASGSTTTLNTSVLDNVSVVP